MKTAEEKQATRDARNKKRREDYAAAKVNATASVPPDTRTHPLPPAVGGGRWFK